MTVASNEEWDRTAPANIALIAATSAALLTLIPVAAHQFGLLAHLPDPSGSIFASDKITDSKAAHPLGIPDSTLGLLSYGATLGLALAAPLDKNLGRLLGLKLLVDGSAAGFNVTRQLISFRKLCSWCTGTAVCTAIMLFAGRDSIKRAVRPVD